MFPLISAELFLRIIPLSLALPALRSMEAVVYVVYSMHMCMRDCLHS